MGYYCPNPQAGKDKEEVASFHRITLTSQISKVVEWMILVQPNHIMSKVPVLPEPVGFREGR